MRLPAHSRRSSTANAEALNKLSTSPDFREKTLAAAANLKGPEAEELRRDLLHGTPD